MYGLRIRNKNGMTFISIKKAFFRKLDMNIMNILNKRLISNICPVDMERHRLIYSAPESETLHNLLKKDNGEISELLISSVIQVTRMLRKYELPVCNIVFNPKAVFYSAGENKIYYIYQPYAKNKLFDNSSGLSSFLFNIINRFLIKKNVKSSAGLSYKSMNNKRSGSLGKKDTFMGKEPDKDIKSKYEDKTTFLGKRDDDLTVFMKKNKKQFFTK